MTFHIDHQIVVSIEIINLFLDNIKEKKMNVREKFSMILRFLFTVIIFMILSGTFLSVVLADGVANIEKKAKDRKAILQMAGCFTVDFYFEETIPLQPGYKLYPKFDDLSFEAVVVLENSPNVIRLQHILETRMGRIIKHWRQDWWFQDPAVIRYEGRGLWKRHSLEPEAVKGAWTQKVYAVDDGPRYEVSGVWTHGQNVSEWTANTGHRPLPRRDYLYRSDYDILLANNRQVITPTGWVHEQDNDKLRLGHSGKEDEILVREIGRNTYRRINSRHCDAIYSWWVPRKVFWEEVRNSWENALFGRDAFQSYDFLPGQDPRPGKHMAGKDKARHHHLFDLANEVVTDNSYSFKVIRKKISSILGHFTFSANANVAGIIKSVETEKSNY